MMKKRTIALLMVAVMLFAVVTGSTIAWLTTKSETVTNTFTVGDINISLDETNIDGTSPARDTANAYKMIPGQKYVKDPIVHVQSGSEPCYVFVKVTETNNTLGEGKVIQYEINDGWVSVGDNVYMYGSDVNTPTVVDALNKTSGYVDTTSVLAFLDDDTNNITINETLTKTTLDAMDDGTTAKPELKFVACAIQSANIEITDAINQAKMLLNSTTP